MKKACIFALCLVFFCSIASGTIVLQRKRAESTKISIPLYALDGVEFSSSAASASGDITITKDEGAEANTDANLVDEGTGYSLALSATEMTAARIVVYVSDQSSPQIWLDEAIIINTHIPEVNVVDVNGNDPITSTALGDLVEAELEEAVDDGQASTSVQGYLVSIFEDTNSTLDTILDAIHADITIATINATVDAAIETYRLDHLLLNADSDDANDNSIIAHLAAADGDWSSFDDANDSLGAIRTRGDAAWTTGSGGTIDLNDVWTIDISAYATRGQAGYYLRRVDSLSR